VRFDDTKPEEGHTERNSPMPTVTNNTKRPLVVPLPQGKKLHLGPGKSGEIAANAVEHAALKKLAEAGEIEISLESSGASDAPGGPKFNRPGGGGAASGIKRRGGDR
jgi:hypothetical protein